MTLLNCAICGSGVHIVKTEAWRGTHGYYGNFWYNVECHKCGLPKDQSVSDISQTEKQARNMVTSMWNKEIRKIEKLLKHREEK